MTNILYAGSTLATTVCVLGGFTLAIFALRFWFRITRRKFDTSDWLLSCAVICGIFQSTIWLVLVYQYRYGHLKADIPSKIRMSQWPSKLTFANQIIFKFTTPLCKLSLCALYLQICPGSTGHLFRRTRIAIWATIVLIVGVYLSAVLVTVLQCFPIHKIWMPKAPGSCIDLDKFRNSTAVFNIMTSAMIITLPIPVLLRLKSQRPEIKQLIGLILLGLLHTSLTVARFVIMFYPNRYVKSEPQYGWIPAYSLAVGEMNANILFASLVVMRPAFQALFKAVYPRRDESSQRTQPDRNSTFSRFRAALEAKKKRESDPNLLQATDQSCMTQITIDIENGGKVVSQDIG